MRLRMVSTGDELAPAYSAAVWNRPDPFAASATASIVAC